MVNPKRMQVCLWDLVRGLSVGCRHCSDSCRGCDFEFANELLKILSIQLFSSVPAVGAQLTVIQSGRVQHVV